MKAAAKRPNKVAKGEIDLERSYQICQAVIQNSPNRAALQGALRPPRLLKTTLVTSAAQKKPHGAAVPGVRHPSPVPVPSVAKTTTTTNVGVVGPGDGWQQGGGPSVGCQTAPGVARSVCPATTTNPHQTGRMAAGVGRAEAPVVYQGMRGGVRPQQQMPFVRGQVAAIPRVKQRSVATVAPMKSTSCMTMPVQMTPRQRPVVMHHGPNPSSFPVSGMNILNLVKMAISPLRA